jgi:hypothetical protein
MKYKTLCRLLVKLMGVYFVAMGLVYLVGQSCSVFMYSGQVRQTLIAMAAWGGGHLLVGGYLFFGGSWIVNRLIPSNRLYCHECGYDLTGSVGNVCAECGTAFRPIETDVEPHH